MKDAHRLQQGRDSMHRSHPVRAGELGIKKSPDKEAAEVQIGCIRLQCQLPWP